ncbi:MAG: phosphoenolpyruvate synthase [Minisyncoccales bacterium]
MASKTKSKSVNNSKKENKFVLKFSELSIEDVPLVGGKNASLGEMYKELTKKNVNIPDGFAVTAYAYRYLLEQTGAKEKIKEILKDLDVNNLRNLQSRGKKVRKLIKDLEFPDELEEAIAESYKKLEKKYRKNIDVAVRSSATAEDLPDASFAGQQETYLNIHGEEELIEACKKCFASLFTNRAISYREAKGFSHFDVALSIGVQKMVRSDLASSGVMFSIDTESGFEDAVFITGAYGLGENVVQGAVNPDEWYVHKPTLKKGKRPILMRKVGTKKIRMIYTKDQKHPTKNVQVSKEDQKKFVITDDEVLKLAKAAVTIEEHYSKKKGKKQPMDIEWAKDGKSGELFIVQARPETVHSNKDKNKIKEYQLKEKSKILVKGKSVGELIGQGKARIIKDVENIHDFKKGEVLVTDMTDPDWEPIMKIASAIVTNRGGRTCFDGETKVLTNKGFMKLKEIYDHDYRNLLTLSFNKETKKTEWKPIIGSMKSQAPRIRISVSQLGRVNDNQLILTPDHKMVNIRQGEITDTEIKNIIENKEMLTIAEKVPELTISSKKEQELSYLLGGIMTDGSIYKTKTHGEVQFIQKETPEKKAFIEQMNKCMTSVYNKSFVPYAKKTSTGTIRGKPATGNATAFRLYSKQIAYDIHEQEQNISETLLKGSKEICYNFLAGVIDGDGSFHNNRIQIYISEDSLLEAVVIACLKLGILPQVTKNRNIYNLQIVEKIDELLKYTKRVKGQTKERIISSRFFSARQILDDNINSQFKLRKDKNLYASEKELRKIGNEKINSLLNGDFRMQRAILTGCCDYDDVYNITVEDNHTYIVFTEKLTPVIVNNCHAAIISRELGIPCIVGTNNGTELLKNKQPITIDCTQGSEGIVYEGLLEYKIKETELKNIPKTKTKIMMNLGNPEQAFEKSFLPNSGVGLAREEFIINSYIKVHPLALLKFNELKDKKVKEEIEEITFNYKNKPDFFVDKLAEGIGTIAAGFYPKPVIVRLSDFKTNEYANLIGGEQFEPSEDNPMLGWRGASRYYSKDYEKAFGLECKALKKVREEMGLDNVKIMIPFPRTTEEAKKVIEVMKKYGLKQGTNGLEVIGMCEIPSNVILAEEFLDIFDGFSIGTNDLTQLILGVDRDSELVSKVYDERNPAVKKFVEQVIKIANKKKKYIGICGQAPSDYPEFARFVVEAGIQTMSLNPDTIIKTTLDIAELEKKLKK